MEKKKVGVFDIDGTIYRSSLWLDLTDKLITDGILPSSARARYEREYERWLDREGDYNAYMMGSVQAFVDNIKGISYDTVAHAAGELIEAKRHRVYCYTRDLIRSLKNREYFILAISHSPKLIVDGFGYEVGVDKSYGSLFETGPSGNFTGVIEHLEWIENKAAVLERAVRQDGLTLDDSYGIGDTESDIPFLEMVEHPIAFNPNKILFDHAKKRGWRIVVERKNVIYEL